MGPVSEEPGLSLWDAMSVLCRRRRARGRRPATGGRGKRGGREKRGGRGGGHTHHSIGNPLRSGGRKGETMRQQGHEPRGRRARAPGAWPSLRPPGVGGPGEGPKGQPSPPHRNFGAFVRGLEVRCPLADRPWPGAPACQSGRPGPGTAGGRGGARRSGCTWESLCRWSPLISAGAASAAGGKGRRGDAGGQDRPVRADGGSRRLPKARGSGGGGGGAEPPGTLRRRRLRRRRRRSDCRAGGESRPQQLCNSLSSHFDSLRLRGRF